KRRVAQLSADAAERSLQQAIFTCAPPIKVARRRDRRARLAIVVQRFGDVIGGAETHARLVARKLSSEYNLTVLTPCPEDHLTWANEFPPGETRWDGIRLIRFATERTRKMRPFNALSRELFRRANDRMSEEQWVAEQGPSAPGLREHIAKTGHSYDAFIF